MNRKYIPSLWQIIVVFACLCALACCWMVSQHNRYKSTRNGRILDTQTGELYDNLPSK